MYVLSRKNLPAAPQAPRAARTLRTLARVCAALPPALGAGVLATTAVCLVCMGVSRPAPLFPLCVVKIAAIALIVATDQLALVLARLAQRREAQAPGGHAPRPPTDME